MVLQPFNSAATFTASALLLVIISLPISILSLSKSTLHLLFLLSPKTPLPVSLLICCPCLCVGCTPAPPLILPHRSISDLPSHSCVSVTVFSIPFFLFSLCLPLFPSFLPFTPCQQLVHSNCRHQHVNDTLSLAHLSMLQYISYLLSAGVDVLWLDGGHHLLKGRTHCQKVCSLQAPWLHQIEGKSLSVIPATHLLIVS